MSDLQEVLRRLPNLAPKELEEVRQRVSFLGGPKKDSTLSRDDWLRTAMAAELGQRGAIAGGALFKFLDKNYEEKAEGVRTHLLAGYVKPKPQHAELLALGRLGASALADWLVKRRIPVRPKTMLDNVDKVPEALEDAFPGYWQAKALGICLEKR